MSRCPAVARSVSACDARRQFPKLLERVERGGRFIITRRGKPVAKLIPFERIDESALFRLLDEADQARARLAQRGVRLSVILEAKESMRELAHAGHRY